MGKIYSYRLLGNKNGMAPCVQDGTFTLACCKRDMRRVIGRQLNLDKSDDIYVVAFAGKNNDMEIAEGQCVYIAKPEHVIRYSEYFAADSPYKNRRDNIYTYIKKPYKETNEKNKEQFWSYISKDFHDNFDCQQRDFDLHHNSNECYVLSTDKFKFFNNKEQRAEVTEKFAPVLCKGQGHRVFPNKEIDTEKCNDFCKLLENYLAETEDPDYVDLNGKCTRRSCCQR